MLHHGRHRSATANFADGVTPNFQPADAADAADSSAPRGGETVPPCAGVVDRDEERAEEPARSLRDDEAHGAHHGAAPDSDAAHSSKHRSRRHRHHRSGRRHRRKRVDGKARWAQVREHQALLHPTLDLSRWSWLVRELMVDGAACDRASCVARLARLVVRRSSVFHLHHDDHYWVW